jgi:hypothetical protein
MIYSPDVPFLRDDNYALSEEPRLVSVITCVPVETNGRVVGAVLPLLSADEVEVLKPEGVEGMAAIEESEDQQFEKAHREHEERTDASDCAKDAHN